MILYGKPLMEQMGEDLKKRVAALQMQKIQPTLAVVEVGMDPAAEGYRASILARGESVDITVRSYNTGESYKEAKSLLKNLAEDDAVHGILLFLPLPESLRHRQEKLKSLIPPEKDVDGVTDGSAAGVYFGNGKGYCPCTAESSIRLLEYYGIGFEGKRAAVVGRSVVIGKPAAMLLLERNATVTICHSRTKDLAEVTSQADILIAAAGCAGLLGKDHVKPGASVVDVGTNWDEKLGKLVGDVRFAEAEPVAEHISPVPGGVGGVTAMVLMEHVVRAAEIAAEKK